MLANLGGNALLHWKPFPCYLHKNNFNCEFCKNLTFLILIIDITTIVTNGEPLRISREIMYGQETIIPQIHDSFTSIIEEISTYIVKIATQ